MKKTILFVILLLTLTACNGDIEYEVSLNPGNDVVSSNETWVDKGCNITINEELFTMERTNDIDYDIYSNQEIVYTYEHRSNTYTCKRVVKVLEEPVFNVILNPGVDSISLDSTHIDTGLSFNDNNESDFTVVVSDDIDTTKRGTYKITYQIYNIDGDILTLYRYVNVT